TGLQTLWVNPNIARGVLDVLAARQADALDPERDAEPGKIVHEVRRGEMAACHEVPFGLYYCTIAATPLFVMLAARYFEQARALEDVCRLCPHSGRRLPRLPRCADHGGDGLVACGRQPARRLANQGRTGPLASVPPAAGTPAQGAIALCEVQGYVYDAKRGAA